MFFTVGESSVAQHISLFALPTRKHTAKRFVCLFFTHLLVDYPQESQDGFSLSFLVSFFLTSSSVLGK